MPERLQACVRDPALVAVRTGLNPSGVYSRKYCLFNGQTILDPDHFSALLESSFPAGYKTHIHFDRVLTAFANVAAEENWQCREYRIGKHPPPV